MKRIMTLFAVSLAIGIVLSAAGGVTVSKGNVNIGDVYDILEKNLQPDTKENAFELPQPPELSQLQGASLDKKTSYPLNEFNTIEIFSEYCNVEMQPTDSEELTLSLEYSASLSNKLFLRTAVKNGSLYAITAWTDESSQNEDVTLKVYIPENYKGGYSLNANHSTVEFDLMESSMDVSLNLYNSTLDCTMISAAEITAAMSGSTLSCKSLTASDSTDILSISSVLSLGRLQALYTNAVISNTTADMKNISGGMNLDAQMSSLNLDFGKINGNITAVSDRSSLTFNLPKSSPASLHYEGSLSSITDNVNWLDSTDETEKNRYNIDTNVKFSIVTLNEKE